jgi:hypothetical protein
MEVVMKYRLTVPLMVVSMYALAGIVCAQTSVTVDCSGNNHQAFQSINAALNTLSLVGPNTINVSGTCHENVSIAQRDRLTIQAAAGHFASIVNAANPPAITLLIAGSHNIVLNNLVIQGGSPALYVTDSSTATAIQNCVVQNSAADGLDVDMASELVIQNSTIRNNSASGIFISNESQMTLGTYPTQRIRITGNGYGGLGIDGSQVQLNFGVLTIDGNAGPGINMEGGRLEFFGGNADSPGAIENNNIGLTMNDAASATFWSAFRIHNNGSTGVSVNGASSITFYSGIDSNGQNAATTIDGHSTVGLSLGGSSSAQIYGPHVISKNGSAGADPGSRGGISMAGASLAIGSGTLVTGNVGPGIRLFAKSDLTMFDMIVSNNTEQGVTETNLSSGGFYNPLTFSGNGEGSLLCDALSVAYGDAGSISGVNCKNITSSSGQRPNIRIPRAH